MYRPCILPYIHLLLHNRSHRLWENYTWSSTYTDKQITHLVSINNSDLYHWTTYTNRSKHKKKTNIIFLQDLSFLYSARNIRCDVWRDIIIIICPHHLSSSFVLIVFPYNLSLSYVLIMSSSFVLIICPHHLSSSFGLIICPHHLS